MKKSRIIEEMYETAKDFHEGDLIDKRRMEEYDAMYKACQVKACETPRVREELKNGTKYLFFS